MIEQVLEGKLRLPEVVARRAAGRGKARPFVVEPEVIINNQWSDRYTVIEVSGLDRPGLLYRADHRDLEAQPQHRLGPCRDLRRARPRRVLRHRPVGRADQRADPAGRDQERADPPARQRRRGGAGGVRPPPSARLARVRQTRRRASKPSPCQRTELPRHSWPSRNSPPAAARLHLAGGRGRSAQQPLGGRIGRATSALAAFGSVRPARRARRSAAEGGIRTSRSRLPRTPGRSASQHSQFGRSSSMAASRGSGRAILRHGATTGKSA